MQQVTASDGTTIAFDRLGDGSPARTPKEDSSTAVGRARSWTTTAGT
jgi:hypothetical protein